MKKVLLSTTALVFAAGLASAEISMSGSATIKSSNFGTGETAAASSDQAISAETDVVITLSGGNDALSYSASLELDETGGLSDGPLNLTMGGLSLTYDDGALGMVSTDADGEDDAYGDYTIAYTMGGLSASYTGDNESDDSIMSVGYSADGMTITFTDTTETAAAGDAGTTNAAKDETKIAVTYAMGAYTVAASSTDNDEYDVSVAYDMGNGTTVTVGTDENSTNFIAATATVAGGLSVSAKQEMNDDDADGNNETELSVSYTSGGMSFSVNYDTGQADHYGDEAETVISASYDLGGGATLAAKATGQDEMEVSVGFKF